MPSVPSIPPPPVGALIADGSLELVDVLGYGGYGVVYRAVDAATRRHQFAVKCLTHAQAARQRTLHLREIQLHRLASAHPAVVSLTRVVEDASFTYIVLDYYADGDLFTQILHKKRYLGNEALIKDVYLQLLDAVQHCHDLNVYHRDLKPENVLCKGDHIAITDFGLATTDEISTEFRTGSIYHMSPECHGPEKQHPSLGIASKGGYNPAANDVWSLGIMLLNLTTGRNPWKSATSSDPTFWAYLHDRANFLPTVLPVSRELNALLVRILDPIWSTRITLPELRREVVKLRSIYADDVVFDDAMARCAWEVALEPESPEESMAEAVTPPVPAVAEAPAKPTLQVQVEHSVSVWSDDTPLNADAHMSFASPSDLEAESFLDLHDSYLLRATQEPSPVVAAASTWSARSSAPGAWRHRSANPSPVSATMPTWLRAASDASSQSDASVESAPSLPPTPKVPETKFARVDYMTLLAIDTEIAHDEAGPDSALYSASSYMRTAVESADDEQSVAPAPAPWSRQFFPAEPAKLVPPTTYVPDSIMNDILKTPILDDEPISPLRFRYMARVDSFTSIGHDADTEDSVISFTSRAVVPRSAPAATTTFQPFGAGRSFFAPRPSGASSSSSVSTSGCVGPVAPRSPAGGKMRSVHTRRGSGRFNPLKLALRSLSPGRAFAADQASSASSRSRSPSPKASVEPRAQRPRLPARKSTGKLAWLGGRLFGAAS